MTDEMAGRWVSRARFLDRFSAVADLATSGELSAGQVDAIRAFCPPRLQPLMAEHQHEVMPTLTSLSTADTIKVMDEWRKKAEAIVEGTAPQAEPQQALSMTTASDGALLGKFELHGGAAAEVAAALKTAATYEGGHDTRTKLQRDADALHDICAFYNRQNDKPTTKRRHPHDEMSLRGDTLTSDLLLGSHPETGRCSITPPPRRCCATASSTRSCSARKNCPSATAGPATAFLATCSASPPSATAAAVSPAAIGPWRTATPTTCTTGARAGSPTTTTSACCATATTTSCTAKR
jgi:hypothetical protein